MMSEDKPEIYVSVDVETDGPIPGPHSMLSVGCAAYLADKTLISTFSANLETLPGASGHPRTMAWWQTEPAAWAAHRKDCVPPEKAMKDLDAWVRALPGTAVFVAFPVTFDFMFVQWYLFKFTGRAPFAHSGLDIRTMAMTMQNTRWTRSTKAHLPREWFDPLPHTHVALDDAIEQGAMFCNMLAELRAARMKT
jgi:DNA polymerase III alpha subunit (gram-positive type)